MAVPEQIGSIGQNANYMHMLIVGDSGFGKTVFAGTAQNALFLTTDPEGTTSAMMMGSTAKEWKIGHWRELNEAFRYLRDGGIEEMGLEWLIIDNISAAQNFGMEATMELARENNSKLDEFISSQQDYLRSQNMLRQMVKTFQDLPVNIIWTSWQAVQENPDTGEIYFAPAIHGQKGSLAQEVAGYMNVVGYGEVVKDTKGNEVRRIWFTFNDAFRGKDRFVCLGAYQDRLTVPKMHRMVEEAKKAAMSSKKGSTGAKAGRPAVKKAPATRRTATRKKA